IASRASLSNLSIFTTTNIIQTTSEPFEYLNLSYHSNYSNCRQKENILFLCFTCLKMRIIMHMLRTIHLDKEKGL
ncbi:MAG: hypothetical protein KAQ70_04310, partial [Candidatus Heimdallarchaeota archaeon]|nr:hypothetical protein [Candidatus Heimdallarchaeota archaeon]